MLVYSVASRLARPGKIIEHHDEFADPESENSLQGSPNAGEHFAVSSPLQERK